MKVYTKYKKLQADMHTPVSIYMKLRDKYAHPLLLESTDYHSANESTSILCFDPLCSFIAEGKKYRLKSKPEEQSFSFDEDTEVIKAFETFLASIDHEKFLFPFPYAGFFGYTSFDSVNYFENTGTEINMQPSGIPEMIYSFYSVVIIINHFNDELFVFSHSEDKDSAEEKLSEVLRELKNLSVPSFTFEAEEKETSDCTDEEFIEMVKKGKKHCRRGDVFQVVLSRKFERNFKGDEFEVYRALRNVNPSPYLYFFDFADFKIFGSSPEAQLVVKKNVAEIHPIAGTVKRSGDDEKDILFAEELKKNEKENAEHIMLVDLARNDLSRHCKNVKVERLREIQFFSHVIHLVSKVTGEVKNGVSAFTVMKDSFPAGTLSGAPKVRAMQIISETERSRREFYGGAVGFIGTDGSLNHAIIIRSFLSKGNTLCYRAGAGVVDASDEISELNEVNNKVGAMRMAVSVANEQFAVVSKQSIKK